MRQVDADRAHRRIPAHADAHAGPPVEIVRVVERAAAVDENRTAPAGVEVVLVLGAGGHHVLGADGEIAVVRFHARPDFAVLIAADAAVATGVIAQAGRHGVERIGEGVAQFAAQDETVAGADRLEPARLRMHLGEVGVRAHAFQTAAQGQRAGDAPARESAVVDVHVIGGKLGIGEGRVAVVDRRERTAAIVGEGIGPAFAHGIERGDGGQVLVDLAAAADAELQQSRVDVVGLFVVGLQRDGVPAIQPLEGGDAVLGDEVLAFLRVVQLGGQFVAARIHVAALQPEAHAGAAFGAVAHAGGVDVALGQGEVDVDRHAAIDGVLRFGLDIDVVEVIQPGQRFAQAIEFSLVEIAAFFPVHQLVQQPGPELGLVEGGRPHVVADAAGPGQADVGGVLGAGDFDAAVDEVGIEVTAVGQPAHDLGLAGFVGGVVEDVADLRTERGQVFLEVAVAAARALDAQVRMPDAHRFALVHLHDHGDVFVLAARARGVDGDLGRVVAERLQRLAGLGLGFAHQVFQPRFALAAADDVVQRQRDLGAPNPAGRRG